MKFPSVPLVVTAFIAVFIVLLGMQEVIVRLDTRFTTLERELEEVQIVQERIEFQLVLLGVPHE